LEVTRNGRWVYVRNQRQQQRERKRNRHAFEATTRVLGLPLAREGAVCEGCKLGVDPCADHTLASSRQHPHAAQFVLRGALLDCGRGCVVGPAAAHELARRECLTDEEGRGSRRANKELLPRNARGPFLVVPIGTQCQRQSMLRQNFLIVRKEYEG
jgi:hypothetical protein